MGRRPRIPGTPATTTAFAGRRKRSSGFDSQPGHHLHLLKTVDDDVIVVGVSMKRTRAGGPVFRKGPFKGKRVELAATTGIERFDDVAEDFMLDVFGFEAGEYLITDLSSLHDFVGVETIRDITSRLGLANVREFGLTWEDCEGFLSRLGYRTTVDVVQAS